MAPIWWGEMADVNKSRMDTSPTHMDGMYARFQTNKQRKVILSDCWIKHRKRKEII